MVLGYGSSTLWVALVVGALALAVGAWRPFAALAGLLLLLPFQEAARRWLGGPLGLPVDTVNALSRWWVVVILALLAVAAVRWLRDRRRSPAPFRPRWVDALFVALIALGLFAGLTSPNRTAGVAAFRNYFQPALVFVLARALWPTPRGLRRFLGLWLVVGALMLALEVWQATSWTAADYRAQGYVRPNGELVVPPLQAGESWLRPASTVTGPNELGMHMVLLFLASVLWAVNTRGRWRWGLAAAAALSLVGLLITFSRSAFLAWVAGAALLILLPLVRDGWNRWRGVVLARRTLLWAAVLVAAMLIVLAVSGMGSHLGSTIANLSSAYHFEDSVQAAQYLLAHPGGVGMGLVSPREGIFFPEQGAYHVEGSLFQIGMEMGVWGLALWLAFLGVALAGVWRAWRRLTHPDLRVVAGLALCAWPGALVAFLFLPLMQANVLMCWLWFLLGLGLESPRVEAAWAPQPASA